MILALPGQCPRWLFAPGGGSCVRPGHAALDPQAPNRNESYFNADVTRSLTSAVLFYHHSTSSECFFSWEAGAVFSPHALFESTTKDTLSGACVVRRTVNLLCGASAASRFTSDYVLPHIGIMSIDYFLFS